MNNLKSSLLGVPNDSFYAIILRSPDYRLIACASLGAQGKGQQAY
jgi:hypothetical protein